MTNKKFNLKNYQTLSTTEIEKKIEQIVINNRNVPFGALMGEAMKELKGKADGKLVSELIQKYMK